MKKAIIIGAGPAGLAAGYKLCESGIPSCIFEKENNVGGLSRTTEYKGNYFDIGPHRFFTKNKEVSLWWDKLLGKDFMRTSRHSRIYYEGKFFKYPISLPDVFLKIGLPQMLSIALDYAKSRLFPRSDESNFENWVINRFGERLYRIFFEGYTEKLWGIPPALITGEWAAQRIKGLSFTAVLRNAVFSERQNKIKTLLREFNYPRMGAGMMYGAAANRIGDMGGLIKLNSEVIEIRRSNNNINGILYRDNSSGTIYEENGTHFCSSMPLDQLVLRMTPQPEENIIKACKQLTYRSLIVVYLVLKKSNISQDNWIYVNSRDVKMGRIQNFKNWSPSMVRDPDTSTLCLEYFCTKGDPFWESEDLKIITLASEELEKLRLAKGEDIIDAFVLRVPYAYPVYKRGYQEYLEQIKAFVKRFSNLYCIGRGGMFKYNNMDHSVLAGFIAATNILGSKQDLWNVNAEQSYHEEFNKA